MSRKISLFVFILCLSNIAYAGSVKKLLPDEYVIELGVYTSSQGKEQHINKTGLIGDQYELTHSKDTAGLISLSALWQVKDFEAGSFSLGINYSYFDNTTVNGEILIENALRNLNYSYTLHHNELLLLAHFKSPIKKSGLETLIEVAVGPNFMTSQNYIEKSLDGTTAPSSTFKGKTTSTLAFRAGASLLASNISKTGQVALGYQFNYLGKGSLNAAIGNVLNNLETGNIYSHAIVFSVLF